MALGSKLKQLLDDRGITIKEFATQITVPPTTLYSFIKRDSETGNWELIAKICKGLNININDFLNYEIETFDSGEEFKNTWNEIAQNVDTSCEYSKISYQSTTKTQLLDYFKQLNKTGEKKALEHVEMLTKIPEYQKKNNKP